MRYEVWFSEVSPRLHVRHGHDVRQRYSEWELHARHPRAYFASAQPSCRPARIAFAGVDEALRVPQSDVRLFGKPESFTRRRMGVALANGRDTDEARERAKLAAGKVRPVKR